MQNTHNSLITNGASNGGPATTADTKPAKRTLCITDANGVFADLAKRKVCLYHALEHKGIAFFAYSNNIANAPLTTFEPPALDELGNPDYMGGKSGNRCSIRMLEMQGVGFVPVVYSWKDEFIGMVEDPARRFRGLLGSRHIIFGELEWRMVASYGDIVCGFGNVKFEAVKCLAGIDPEGIVLPDWYINANVSQIL